MSPPDHDIASGWTECVSLAERDGSLVVEALTRLRTKMPFSLRASTAC